MKKGLSTTLLVVMLVAVGCKQVDFTAPGGSTLTLVAQPTTVSKDGVSNLTVTGIRANGAPLPDDTVVRFTVSGSGGIVTPDAITLKNGIGTTHFVAGQKLGDATITAFSGDATADVTITVETPTASTVIVTANPASLPVEGGHSKIRAYVFDEEGNPVGGIKVFFQTDAGTLESAGKPVVTNSSGLAKDVLNTDATAHLTVTTNDGATGQIDITVAEAHAPVCSFVVSPNTTVGIDDDVTFIDTSTDEDGNIVTSAWEFGDGGADEGSSVTHSYDSAGSFTAIHSVTDDSGLTDICDPVTITVEEAPPAIPNITIDNPSVAEGDSGTTTLTFTVTLSQSTTSTVSVHYSTANGTATAPTDYLAISDTVLNIPSGNTTATIDVTINGDSDVEPDETFVINLSNATGGTITDSQGVGTITNDDP